MQKALGTETLKSGETLLILRVEPPDEVMEPYIKPFLAHKPSNYIAHIEAAFAGQCDDLETYFYIGLLDGKVVGNIMTTEQHGVGIFGHVHTRSDQRRKGICSAILKHLMDDFRQRAGRVLLLGTDYQSAAYHIYAGFGFRDWKVGRPGLMRYDAPDDPDFETRFFAPSFYTVEKAMWKHWPLISLLAAVPSEVYLRSIAFDLWGVHLLEGPYCRFLQQFSGNPETAAFVLQSDTGAVAAMATCIPDARWRGTVHLLDVFQHPMLRPGELTPLLNALPFYSQRIQCYADPRDTAKIGALEQAGFCREAILSNQFREGNQWRDAYLYGR